MAGQPQNGPRLWQVQVCQSLDLSGPIQKKIVARMNIKTLNSLYSALSEGERKQIITCVSAKQAWKVLLTTYKGNEQVREHMLQDLWLDFDELKMSESESIDEFYNRILNITNQCAGLDAPLDQSRIVRKFLRGLPPSYENKRVAIQEAKDLRTHSLEELVGNLKTYEAHKKGLMKKKSIALSSIRETDSSLQIKIPEDVEYSLEEFGETSQDRSHDRYLRNTRVESSQDRGQDRNSKGKNHQRNETCFECKGVGHRAVDCAHRRNRPQKAFVVTYSDSEEDPSSDKEEDTVAFTARFVPNSSLDHDEEPVSLVWILILWN
ncbi:PREDICTED: uncharacterized protein LOC101296349 [Fragaria vesca subsp. vesca]|uniref:uncharacterized protein LOC101296349 n=1 Tax=Fragaria vesca subsp. vesca TaxID=101020 RepID=UPI0002C2FC6C|nr:PREDICTED: uncharacterized protein LOC101296349 [Fragaria vesca subsp. vesca]